MSTHVAAVRRKRPTRSRTSAWDRFRRDLAAALASLGKDQYLIVAAKKGHRFVQFAKGKGTGGPLELRAEAVSNNYLAETERLTRKQVAALAALGWNAPTHEPKEPHVKNGSPNFFRDFQEPLLCDAIARLSVRTLSEVFRIRQPSDLEYRSFERSGDTELLFPTLGIDREQPAPRPPSSDDQSLEEARGAVLRALREASKIDTLAYDEDGDIPVPYGKALLFVHVHDAPRFVRVLSAVVKDVELDQALLRRINQANEGATLVRFLFASETIWASSDVFAHPLVPRHVVHACHVVGEVANDLHETLQRELTEQPEAPRPTPKLLLN